MLSRHSHDSSSCLMFAIIMKINLKHISVIRMPVSLTSYSTLSTARSTASLKWLQQLSHYCHSSETFTKLSSLSSKEVYLCKSFKTLHFWHQHTLLHVHNFTDSNTNHTNSKQTSKISISIFLLTWVCLEPAMDVQVTVTGAGLSQVIKKKIFLLGSPLWL